MKRLIAALLLISGCCVCGMEETLGKAIDEAVITLRKCEEEVRKWEETEKIGELSKRAEEAYDNAMFELGYWKGKIRALKDQQQQKQSKI